jgi:pilus assembly protein CpaB
LLATPEQAEILTLANSEGRIQLVLRNSGDQEISQTSGSHVSELYTGKKRAAPAPPAPPRPVVIRGTQRSVELVANPAGQ